MWLKAFSAEPREPRVKRKPLSQATDSFDFQLGEKYRKMMPVYRHLSWLDIFVGPCATQLLWQYRAWAHDLLNTAGLRQSCPMRVPSPVQCVQFKLIPRASQVYYANTMLFSPHQLSRRHGLLKHSGRCSPHLPAIAMRGGSGWSSAILWQLHHIWI